MTIVVSPSGIGATSSDVPTRFDVVIDGKGYRLLDAIEPSLPFRTHKAVYTYSPTFIQRTNVQGSYGDNQQEFFLTLAQKDWSLGEQLKFFRLDEEKSRRYWQGKNVDIGTPGQATIRQAVKSLTFAGAVRAVETRGPAANADVLAASTTNLYEVDPAGTITDKGAHGLGAAPSKFGIASDGNFVFLSTTAGGTVGVRKWTGSAYSTWSANGADSLEFLNNILYGFDKANSKLVKWGTTGTQSDVFLWKGADGTARGGNFCRVRSYGGKLLAMWADGPDGPELWIYDGSGTYILAVLPPDFYASDVTVALGVVFIAGSHVHIQSGATANLITRPAIYFYANGNLGRLWLANTEMTTASTDITTASHPSVVPFSSGIAFNDDTTGNFMYYETSTGGVHSIGTYTVAGDTPLIGASQRVFVHTRNQTTGYFFPDTTTIATTAEIKSSLIDFDSSLDKYFKGIKIDASIPSGASIDIAYLTNDLTNAYTNIVTGAASGTEYSIGTTARSLGYRITLNKGTAATSPTLTRVYLRAAPLLQSFKKREYVLDLSGKDGRSPIILRDQTPHSKTGAEMAADLITTLGKNTAVAVTDEFGTFNALIEPEGFELLEIRSKEYVARVPVREV